MTIDRASDLDEAAGAEELGGIRRLATDRQPAPPRARAPSFVQHHNSHRPHRALNLTPSDPNAPKLSLSRAAAPGVERRGRLGGLIYEYRRAA